MLKVERDRVRAAEGSPGDPGYSDQWSLPRIGWDEVYGVVDPAGSAVVAVLDTGVDAGHADLAGRVVAGKSLLPDSDPTVDPNGHGTAIAGIVAAATDNGTGIAGIGFAGVKVMPVTVLDADGLGQDSDIIEGIVWAVDHGADVINLSFSNPGYSAALQAAVDYAWDHDVVVVAATGNDGVERPDLPGGRRRRHRRLEHHPRRRAGGVLEPRRRHVPRGTRHRHRHARRGWRHRRRSAAPQPPRPRSRPRPPCCARSTPEPRTA